MANPDLGAALRGGVFNVIQWRVPKSKLLAKLWGDPHVIAR